MSFLPPRAFAFPLAAARAPPSYPRLCLSRRPFPSLRLRPRVLHLRRQDMVAQDTVHCHFRHTFKQRLPSLPFLSFRFGRKPEMEKDRTRGHIRKREREKRGEGSSKRGKYGKDGMKKGEDESIRPATNDERRGR